MSNTITNQTITPDNIGELLASLEKANELTFTNCHFSGEFKNVNLSGCVFKHSIFSFACFTECKFKNSRFEDTCDTNIAGSGILKFKNCDMYLASMINSCGITADFNECSMPKVSFAKSRLVSCTFTRCYLDGGNFEMTTIRWVSMTQCSLINANLSRSKATGLVISGCKLNNAELQSTELTGCCSILDSDLDCAQTEGLRTYNTTFAGSKLNGVKLPTWVCSNSINFCGADLRTAIIPPISIIDGLIDKVLKGIKAEKEKAPDFEPLQMHKWHKQTLCGTAHCLAGWLVTVHPEGKLLEGIYGTPFAATMILTAHKYEIPDFYDVELAHAMAWLENPKQFSTT